MREAIIVSTARTPIGRAYKGAFNATQAPTLGAHAIAHAVKRAGIEGAEVDDVIMGCAFPEGEQGMNVARNIAFRAGLPSSVPGMTVNRYCSSGLQTIAIAAENNGCKSVAFTYNDPVIFAEYALDTADASH